MTSSQDSPIRVGYTGPRSKLHLIRGGRKLCDGKHAFDFERAAKRQGAIADDDTPNAVPALYLTLNNGCRRCLDA